MAMETIENFSEMVPLEQLAIDRTSWAIFSIHFLQKKGILTPICCNLEGTLPDIFEFTVLTLLLIPRIPLQHHIIQLKFVCLCFSVINFLNLLLQLGYLLENFFFGLLQMDHLIQSSLHRIVFTADFLKKFDYRGCERGRKQCINSVHKLKGDIPMDFF